ncbi:hypothetical protein BH09PSE5_BH09PSE5_04930 [soil metagenome]
MHPVKFSQCCPSLKLPRLGTTLRQPSLMLLKAVSLVGATKPECTSLNRVPSGTLVNVKVTTVSSFDPYPSLPSSPPFQD